MYIKVNSKREVIEWKDIEESKEDYVVLNLTLIYKKMVFKFKFKFKFKI